MIKVEKCGISFEVTPSIPVLNDFWENHFPIWETETYNHIIPCLDNNKTFLDIGAWHGPISMVAQKFSKQCICFEPDKVAYKYLKANIEANGFKNIITENLAVSNEPTLKLGEETLGNGTTRFSNPNNVFEADTISISEIFKKYNLTESNVSVIKIDIEGYESELLKDPVWKTLNVNFHISLHALFAKRAEKYFSDLRKFFGEEYIFSDKDNDELFIKKR